MDALAVKEVFDAEFLYENSPCGYVTYKLDGTIIQVNKTLVTWLQIQKKDIIGSVKFNGLLSKGSRFYYDMVIMPLLQIKKEVNEINLEIKLGNSNFPCLYNALAVTDATGAVIAINAIILNITDRRRYESLLLSARKEAEKEKKRFEFLSNTIPNIIWTASATGKIDFVNDRFYETFGNKPQALRFDSFLHLIHPTERRSVFNSWKISLQSGQKLEVEVRLQVSFLSYEWFLITAVPYLDVEGVVVNWFGSFANIHAHKEAERQTVERLNDSIDRKSQTLREIAFAQSHLIRHPLTNILGIIYLLKDVPMDDNMKKMFGMLQASAENLDTVIKDIVYKTYS